METDLPIIPIGHKIFKEFITNLTNYVILDQTTFLVLNCKIYFVKCQQCRGRDDQREKKLGEILLSRSNLIYIYEKLRPLQLISVDKMAENEMGNQQAPITINPTNSRTNITLEVMAGEIIASVRDIPEEIHKPAHVASESSVKINPSY